MELNKQSDGSFVRKIGQFFTAIATPVITIAIPISVLIVINHVYPSKNRRAELASSSPVAVQDGAALAAGVVTVTVTNDGTWESNSVPSWLSNTNIEYATAVKLLSVIVTNWAVLRDDPLLEVGLVYSNVYYRIQEKDDRPRFFWKSSTIVDTVLPRHTLYGYRTYTNAVFSNITVRPTEAQQ